MGDGLKTKTLWKNPESAWSFFCPHCRAARRLSIPSKPTDLKMVARIALTTLFVTVVTWPWFGMSGIVSGVVIWMIYEWAYRMRRRALVVCPHCGFDPFLYMVDLGKARQAVRDFWQKRQPVPPAQDSLTESQVER